MKRSAASSRSSVVTPGRAFPRSIVRPRARIRPAASIFSISSGDFLTIICSSEIRDRQGELELVLETQRGEGGADVVVDLARRARRVEPSQDALLVVVPHKRARLLVVDLEPPLDRLRLVVVALDQARPVLVADVLALRWVEIHVVEMAVLHADAAAAEPPHHLVVRRVEQQRGGDPPAELLQAALEHVRLAKRAR